MQISRGRQTSNKGGIIPPAGFQASLKNAFKNQIRSSSHQNFASKSNSSQFQSDNFSTKCYINREYNTVIVPFNNYCTEVKKKQSPNIYLQMAKSKFNSTLGQVVKSIPSKNSIQIANKSNNKNKNKNNNTNNNTNNSKKNSTKNMVPKAEQLVKCSSCKLQATYYWDCNSSRWTWACSKCRIFGYIAQWKDRKPSSKVMKTLAMLRALNFSPESRFDTIQSITSNKTQLESLYTSIERETLASSSIWDISDDEDELNKTIVEGDDEDDDDDPEPGIGEDADAEYFGYEIWEEDDNDFEDEGEDDDEYEEDEEEDDPYDGSYSDDD